VYTKLLQEILNTHTHTHTCWLADVPDSAVSQITINSHSNKRIHS